MTLCRNKSWPMDSMFTERAAAPATAVRRETRPPQKISDEVKDLNVGGEYLSEGRIGHAVRPPTTMFKS